MLDYNGAIVYAKNAIIKNNGDAKLSYLRVDETLYLHSLICGTDGAKNFTLENKGTIVGTRQYSIFYNMNDTFMDQATNLNDSHYVEGIGVQLVDPTRFGYVFKGWYDKDNNKVTEIITSDVGDKELNVVWEVKTVEFVITTSATDAGLSIDEFRNQVNMDLTANGSTVTKEIMEYYLTENIPIEITVCEYVNQIAEY